MFTCRVLQNLDKLFTCRVTFTGMTELLIFGSFHELENMIFCVISPDVEREETNIYTSEADTVKVLYEDIIFREWDSFRKCSP